MSRVEMCEGCLEQTQEEDLLPAAGVRPLFCLLMAPLTGTDEWETDDLMDI